MRTYKLQKRNPQSKKAEVREKRFEVQPLAIVACLLLAVAIWLYVVSFMPPMNGDVPPETPAETSAGPNAPHESDAAIPSAAVPAGSEGV